MKNTKKLATCAMLVALATALAIVSLVIPLQLPFGGSVTFASMLPIVIAAYMYGTKWGLGTAFVFAFIQMLLGGKTVASFFMPGDSQMFWLKAVIVCLIDYIIAYTVLGFGGIFSKKIKNPALSACAGGALATLLRYVCHTVSGAIFFGVWAEGFFAEWGPFAGTAFGTWVMQNLDGNSLAWFYSLVYNGLYMIPEIIITSVGAYIVTKALKKYIVTE